MSSKQTEFKHKSKKRPFNDINEIDCTEPQLKRRKIARKFAHLNFDPTKLIPGHGTAPKPATKKLFSTAKELDQSVILNKPIIPHKHRKKRSKKRIQIPIAKEPINEIIEVPNNIKNMILNSKDLFDENEHIKCIRFLENERIKIYSSNNKIFKNGKYKLSIEFTKQNDEIFEKLIVINDKNEIFELEYEDNISFDEMSISECIEYTFNENEWLIAEISNESLECYKNGKFLNWKNQIMKPICEAAFKRLLCIGLITNIFDRFVFKSPKNEEDNFIIKDINGRNVNIPRPVKKLRKWNVKNRKYENINPHLNGAPQPNEANEYWGNMIKEFKGKYGNEYIENLLSSFKTQ